jgi:hypothetical protein
MAVVTAEGANHLCRISIDTSDAVVCSTGKLNGSLVGVALSSTTADEAIDESP